MIPSNARREPHAHRVSEWDRRDPGYHGPLSREDIGSLIRVLPAAIIGLIGLWAFCALVLASVPGPGQ